MTERDCERVARVQLIDGDTERGADHELDLLLGGLPFARHGLLDLGRCVLGDRDLALHRGDHHDALDAEQLARRLSVLAHERDLNGDGVRLVLVGELDHAGVNLVEAQRVVFGRLHLDGAVIEGALGPSFDLDDAVASRPGARVDAENDHEGTRQVGVGTRRRMEGSCFFPNALGPDGCERLVVEVEGGVDRLHVLVVIELVDQAEHLLGVLGLEGGRGGRDLLDTCFRRLNAGIG